MKSKKSCPYLHMPMNGDVYKRQTHGCTGHINSNGPPFYVRAFIFIERFISDFHSGYSGLRLAPGQGGAKHKCHQYYRVESLSLIHI